MLGGSESSCNGCFYIHILLPESPSLAQGCPSVALGGVQRPLQLRWFSFETQVRMCKLVVLLLSKRFCFLLVPYSANVGNMLRC